MTNLKVEGLVTFCYYDNLEKGSNFYREVMGFELVFATNFAKIYKLKDNAYIGLVKRSRSVIPSLNIIDGKAIKNW